MIIHYHMIIINLQSKQKRNNMKKCFTLIEMLVVIAIIGILASMLAPSLRRALGSATSVSCLNNLRQCGYTFTQYANAHDGIIPFERAASGFPQWANQFGANDVKTMPGHFVCPGGATKPKSTSNTYGALCIAVVSSSLAEHCNNPQLNSKVTSGTDQGKAINVVNVLKMRSASHYPMLCDSVFYTSTQYNDAGAQSYTVSSPKDNSSGLHFRHVHKLNILFGDNHANGVEVGRFLSDVVTANGAVKLEWHLNNKISQGWLRAEDYTIQY